MIKHRLLALAILFQSLCAFGEKNMFGTDGIRTTIGKSPLTSAALPQLGRSLGQWIVNRYGPNAQVIIGHDTRISCDFVKAGLTSGMLLYPITLHDAHVLPTPGVYLLMEKNPRFDCGIIISASHNPFFDNGIKIVDRKNGKLSADDEKELSRLFHAAPQDEDYTKLGTIEQYNNATNDYISTIINHFDNQFLNDKVIVLDCANGATSSVAPVLFEKLGATVHTINASPNGTNINDQCGALHTEQLQKAVIKHKADAGFAFDGDGDRVIAVNRLGQQKNGDDIIALLLEHPHYQKAKRVVGTIMTNQGMETYLKTLGIELIRTPVGDKYVLEQLKKENLLLGGEQSGHIIMRDFLDTGDGIVTALTLLEALVKTNNWDMNTFKTYPQILINVPITEKKQLTKSPLAEVIAHYKAQLLDGRIEVRYSGTEPLLRVMTEDSDADHAQLVCSKLAQQLQKELNTV